MEISPTTTPAKTNRHYLPTQLTVDQWSTIDPYFKELLSREISSVAALEKWLRDRSELESFLSEDFAWRYIKMTCDTANPELMNSYNFFVSEIDPHIAPYANELNKKLVGHPLADQLDTEKYRIFLRGIRNALALYREENIPLQTKIATESQKYGAITALMTIDWNGEEITLQKAGSLLKDTDRAVRESVFRKIKARREQDRDTLNDLFSELLALRNQVALNAGFKNYRDYKFEELGRFDYSVDDCFDFHRSIFSSILPLAEQLDLDRKKALHLEQLKLWDMDVDVHGRAPLHPFENGNDLIEKSIRCFQTIRPAYGEYLSTMRKMGHLDLESRKGKAPGGYNYPLQETGVPFIFMNAVGVHRDMVTMVHEGGHAIHSFVTRDLELADFKSVPSEVAELASMSMELISMEHWDVFFENPDDLRRAKNEQLTKILKTLLWIAAVDKFQHWIYEHPQHSIEERMNTWGEIAAAITGNVVDWKDEAAQQKSGWQSQLHIFEVPFYYIEYGMAQLGAIAVWRNYKKDPVKALDQYEAALRLGYTKSIPEIYRTAGIEFNFSGAYVKELADFVHNELSNLYE